jgi:hypothetical protein
MQQQMDAVVIQASGPPAQSLGSRARRVQAAAPRETSS